MSRSSNPYIYLKTKNGKKEGRNEFYKIIKEIDSKYILIKVKDYEKKNNKSLGFKNLIKKT